MEAAAASAVEFHALSRRDLQALCKRNGVRANMTNAAMADALQNLTSVDEIGTIGDEQQHWSPLPRACRVSVMSPAAIRMDVEEGVDELKRDLVKEIVKTPGVALRSTSRRARATPAPLPTPATLRRSQRTASRKAAAPVEAENRVEEASSRSKMMVDLDLEEVVAAAIPKVQQEEAKAVASEVKCDDPEEEEVEVTKLLEGDNKEEGEEVDSSDAANRSALRSDTSCDDRKEVVTMDQEATKPQEGIVEEQEPISAQKSATLAPMEDSPIIGVLSRAEATKSLIRMAEDASDEDDEGGAAGWSPVNEVIFKTNPDVEDHVEAIGEVAVKEDGFTVTGESVHSQMEILPAATEEDDTGKEDLTEELKESADEMQQAELTEEEASDELDEDEEWSSDDDEASEEIDSTDESEDDCTEVKSDFDNVKELVQVMQGTSIASKASKDSAEEASEGDGLADEEASEDGSDDEEASEDGLSDVEASEDVSVDVEASEDGSADEDVSEEDDFTSDLPLEFDNIVALSDAETENDTTSAVKESQAAVASATKTSVKSTGHSAISVTNKEEVSEEKDVTDEAMMEVANTVDNIVKSFYECTKEGTQQSEEEKVNTMVETVGQNGKPMEDYSTMSMRKLKSTLKNQLSTKEEGKKHAEVRGCRSKRWMTLPAPMVRNFSVDDIY